MDKNTIYNMYKYTIYNMSTIWIADIFGDYFVSTWWLFVFVILKNVWTLEV